MDLQAEIRWFMRPFLLDFLIEAHAAFNLRPQTLYLAINLVDRYCSRRTVYRRHFQLLGCAALLVAAKFGDRKERVPAIAELQGMCCDLYDHKMFQQIEWHVLETVDWFIGHPTPDTFLAIAMDEMDEDVELEHMALYLCESALFHREFVAVLPSVLVRAALALAMELLGRGGGPQDRWARDYDVTVCQALANHLGITSAILSRKYAASEFSSVAVTLEAWMMEHGHPALDDEVDMVLADLPLDPVYRAPAHGMAHPQTPQKGSVPGALGVFTPPITPENAEDVAMQGQYAHPVDPAVYHARPATPTSDPSYGVPPMHHHHLYNHLNLGYA